MIRLILPAIILGTSADAQSGGLCQNIPHSQNNCVRVLACVGDEGLFYDGQARGWDAGRVQGTLSDGINCNGTWTSEGLLGTGLAQLTCDDGTMIDVVYHSQDGLTGTAIGTGQDSLGRRIKVWSGENVLEFLTEKGAFGPALPCVDGAIPLS